MTHELTKQIKEWYPWASVTYDIAQQLIVSARGSNTYNWLIIETHNHPTIEIHIFSVSDDESREHNTMITKEHSNTTIDLADPSSLDTLKTTIGKWITQT